MTDVLIDLRAFSEALPQEHGKLKKAIRRWIDLHSAHSDLSLAHDYIQDALRLHRTKRAGLQYATLALQQSAVVIYARALERKSDHRGQVRVTGGFTGLQLEFHRKLVALRDNSVAHFGPEGSSKPWSQDFVFLLVKGVVYRPTASSRRSLFDKKFAEQMLAHFLVAAGLVAKQSQDWQLKLADRLNEAINDDEIFKLLQNHKISPEVFGEAAQLILNPTGSGRATKIIPD